MAESTGEIVSEEYTAQLTQYPEISIAIQPKDNCREDSACSEDSESIYWGELSPYYSKPSHKPKERESPARDLTSEVIENSDDWSNCSEGEGADVGEQRNNNIPRPVNNNIPRPEKLFTGFALRLVILEKIAGGVGILAFIWASVVLLGGFATTLKAIDFWFVTAIFFMEGTSIFKRNHQLESRRFFFQAAKHIVGSIGPTLTFLQLSFAIACVTLSLIRLVMQDYSDNNHGDGNETSNQKGALLIFYTLALAHALVFLFLKAYWFWYVHYIKIIKKVCQKCGFEVISSGVVPLRRFFHDIYWKLTEGNVINTLDLDLISFAQGILTHHSHGEQLIAVRIMDCFITHTDYAAETHRRIKASRETIDRLFSMLSWEGKADKVIRIHAANIVATLASKSELLVEGIPQAMDSISSLLNDTVAFELNLAGLKILNNLARNHKNCWQISQTHGLLPTIIEFTSCTDSSLTNEDDQFKKVKRTLKLLKRIVTTEGKTGQILRREISQISTTISNLRDVLINHGKDPVLFTLVVEILKALSMDKTARRRIGNTVGIIETMLPIFLDSAFSQYECFLNMLAGEALEFILPESKANCLRLLKLQENSAQMLTNILFKDLFFRRPPSSYWGTNVPVPENYLEISNIGEAYKVVALKIVRNLFTYSGIKGHDKLSGVISALPWVLKTIVTGKELLLDASLGLCVQICKFTSIRDYIEALRNADVARDGFAARLVRILHENKYPNVRFPSLRRYVIELAVWMMQSDDDFIRYFSMYQMGAELPKVAETTSELENFLLFSGDVGVIKHPKSMYSLVRKAQELLSGTI